ncbi:MAG: hypothetical protein JWL71_4121 [Acidobacteria bacterium]|nr:hypothetical protein [Acidobacteriota bacterium]
MSSRLASWAEVASIAGDALLIVNSTASEEAIAADVIERLGHSHTIYAIAPSSWVGWLATRGIPETRVIASCDQAGNELELNHFLESPAVLGWTGERAFGLVIGTAAHGRHNEEVKYVFEQRVAAFLRHGVFVAHALPLPELYMFDLAAVCHRLGRERRLAQYESRARDMVATCYALWEATGRPSHSDDMDRTDVMSAVRASMGDGIVQFDENAPVRLSPDMADGAAAAALVVRLGDTLVREIQVRDQAIRRLDGELKTRFRRTRQLLWRIVHE